MEDVQAAQPVKLTRDQIREKFFAAQPRRQLVTLDSGAEVEVVQLSVGEQLALGSIEDPGVRVLRMIVDHVFMPGTNEKVLEDTDIEIMKNLPAQGDYSKLLECVNRLMGIDQVVKDVAKK